jgi:hypothetical protein
MCMTRYSRICLILSVLVSTHVYAQAASPSAPKLRYAPPALVNPQTILLGTGATTTTMDPTRDYIIQLPKEKKTGYTYLIGGRNIVLIGGHITIPTTADLSNKAPSRAIYIKNSTGTVHIEGVLIDASGGAQSDAVDVSAPQAIVQVQNVRVENIYGFYDQFHADVIQTFGGVKELRVDRLTGYSGYQGLQIDVDGGPTGSAKLSNINLVSIGKQTWGPHNNGGFLMWLVKDGACNTAYPITLENVYLMPRAERTLDSIVWPTGADKGCASTLSADGNTLSFPKLPVISGLVKKGMPPSGDFVPAGMAGVNYISPGYRP